MEETNRRIIEWLATGETGISSKTIAFTILGQEYPDACHPHDPADLRRCVQLLDILPAGRVLLEMVRPVSPIWNDLIDHWDELTTLLERELFQHGNRAPDTYARMKEIIGERW